MVVVVATKGVIVGCSLVQKWPNTYSFTKAIAETLLLNYEDVPIAIVRPSIRKFLEQHFMVFQISLRFSFGMC